MITDVPGLRVGHWTDPEAATGCTVVLFPEGTVASGEVRGGAPASRETALLDPTRTIDRIDALVLTGGSAFGLSTADGVMRFCEERGLGVPTTVGPVPIVVALALFDLAVGDPTVRPGPDQGYAACEAATAGRVELGRVGAGTGATVGTGTLARVTPPPSTEPDTEAQTEAGPAPTSGRRPGGLVSATVRSGQLVVSALVAVNAFGIPGGDDTMAPDLAAALGQLPAGWRPAPGDEGDPAGALGNTVIGLVATNARLDKIQCHLVAQSAHDGLARGVFPAHTRLDGDAFVAAAVGEADAGKGDTDVDAVRILAVHAVASAMRSLAPHDP